MSGLSIDKHCEMLTAHIRDRNVAIMDGFKLFVQMFSAVVGGAIILRLQYAAVAPSFASLADALTGLILITGIVIVWENIRSWYQYRKVLSSVAGVDETGNVIVPGPRPFIAMRVELVMTAVMLMSWVGFLLYNPLRLPA